MHVGEGIILKVADQAGNPFHSISSNEEKYYKRRMTILFEGMCLIVFKTGLILKSISHVSTYHISDVVANAIFANIFKVIK